jgi:hypothetical protein
MCGIIYVVMYTTVRPPRENRALANPVFLRYDAG